MASVRRRVIGLMDRIRGRALSHLQQVRVRDSGAVFAAAQARVTVVLTTLLIALAIGGGAFAAAGTAATGRGCAAILRPGTIAPAGTPVPDSLDRRYAVLRRSQRRADWIDLRAISPSLTATGVIASGVRFLGRAAYGGRIYLVPAEHELSFPLAPERCLPAGERSLEHDLRPGLLRQYRHAALCLVVIDAGTGSPTCGPVPGTPDPLLYASGTPGFGLVPDGIPAVTVTYTAAPPRTLRVAGNFFVIRDVRQTAPPCGVQWLDAAGAVLRTPAGCSLLALESAPLQQYDAYVAGALRTLATQVDAIAAAIGDGDIAAARAAWLPAHLTWLSIGQDDGAYGAFGALGGAIDGTAAGHPQGTADPGFTGFHRIEYDLWSTDSLTDASADTARLRELLGELSARPLTSYLPDTAVGIANWLLRPHEIVEDAIRDTLTGDDEYGSGTGVASLVADASAVRELLGLLGPVLDPIAPGLAGIARGELARLVSDADATRTAGGGWIAVAALPTRQREQLDADAGAAAETLAPVPDLLTSTGRGSGD